MAADRPVLNVDEARGFAIAPDGGSDRFGAAVVRIGDVIGARQFGCTNPRIEPGSRVPSFHSQTAGDVDACQAGGPVKAHRIVSSGSETLRDLTIKLAALEIALGEDFTKAHLRHVGCAATGLEYGDGET